MRESDLREERKRDAFVNHYHLSLSSSAGVAQETFPQEYDVYLSYSGENYLFAQEVKDCLVQAGKTVYDYEMDSPLGNNIPEEKGDMIMERCRKMVVVLSPSYVGDKWCKFEASLAKAKSPGKSIDLIC